MFVRALVGPAALLVLNTSYLTDFMRSKLLLRTAIIRLYFEVFKAYSHLPRYRKHVPTSLPRFVPSVGGSLCISVW